MIMIIIKSIPMNSEAFGGEGGQVVRKHSGFKPTAFTIVELLMVLGTLAVLVVVVLPALAGTQAQSKVTACATRYRQWAASANLYAGDHQGYLPLRPSANSGDNPAGGGAYADDVAPNLPTMLYPYGMDIPDWFCPMRPAELDSANQWAQANYGQILNINELRNYWSRSYANECVINDNYWVQRYNGSYGSSIYFPTDFSTVLQSRWPSWLKAGMPTCALYGWPQRLHDRAVPYVPFVSDLAASGNGGGLQSPVGGIGTTITNTSPNTAHFVNGTLIGVNLAFADGHVASHTPDQMRCVYGSNGGPPFWFY